MSTRRQIGGQLGVLAILASCWLSGVAATAADVVTTELAPGIAMLSGRGGNIGVSYGEDGVVLVDDQYAGANEKILEAVAGLSAEPIRFVLNTHWHGDHTGGNELLGRSGAVIVAHENVRRRMSTKQWNELFSRETPASASAALPVVTFAAGVTIHLNGLTIDVIHVAPAHTDGDVLIHFREADVLHLGDTFFNGFYPFIDLDSQGSLDGMIAAAERALEIAGPDTKIIPGHGPLANSRDLREYRDMLVRVRAAVQREIDAGKTPDEVLASRPTRDFDVHWGGGFMKPEIFTRILDQSLRRTLTPAETPR